MHHDGVVHWLAPLNTYCGDQAVLICGLQPVQLMMRGKGANVCVYCIKKCLVTKINKDGPYYCTFEFTSSCSAIAFLIHVHIGGGFFGP